MVFSVCKNHLSSRMQLKAREERLWKHLADQKSSKPTNESRRSNKSSVDRNESQCYDTKESLDTIESGHEVESTNKSGLQCVNTCKRSRDVEKKERAEEDLPSIRPVSCSFVPSSTVGRLVRRRGECKRAMVQRCRNVLGPTTLMAQTTETTQAGETRDILID
ncbi:hypothetical protein E2C01_048281 [Portunus trituberculatus]|uniref:Uncharacterized protein n=1 Tax=Portunus trituberculatus TaxID=210409 RepID=A0A5B7G2R3_PORTR|nr:hypothetical protein [Portunus trituberculatus]